MRRGRRTFLADELRAAYCPIPDIAWSVPGSAAHFACDMQRGEQCHVVMCQSKIITRNFLFTKILLISHPLKLQGTKKKNEVDKEKVLKDTLKIFI